MASDKQAEPEYGDEIDASTFEQILEMDDDDDREFSSALFVDFKVQAELTICNMQAYVGLDTHDPGKPDNKQVEPTVETNISLKEKLTQLSHGGHFLKGSSATLGLHKVQKGCEKIQHFGQGKNEAGDDCDDSDEKQLSKIKDIVVAVKKDYEKARDILDQFYAV